MSAPHGGKLVNRLVAMENRQKVEENAQELFTLHVDEEVRKDLESIAYGIFSPLEGPLLREDYINVLEKGRLSNDVPWTFPIILSTSEEIASSISEEDEVAIFHNKTPFAVLNVEEKYKFDKKSHSKKVFKTTDLAHPGVTRTYEMGSLLIGGQIDLFRETLGELHNYRLKPRETRFLFKEMGWRTIAGFQTRNAPHLGHEYVQKTALAFVDGLFINPLIGRKKPGDFKDKVIVEAYEALLEHYYLKDVAVLVTLEMEMRYAGPREAIFHAIVRKNFGCTHFIVGRDHAGVGSYYGPYESQEKFQEYPDLGITPLFFRSFFYCKKCGGIENDKICPHNPEEHIAFSGTKMRELLMHRNRPQKDLMRPEVVDTILRHKEPFVR